MVHAGQIPARVGDQPNFALSGIAAVMAAGTEYEKINQTINYLM